jgi:hypothetical protein
MKPKNTLCGCNGKYVNGKADGTIRNIDVSRKLLQIMRNVSTIEPDADDITLASIKENDGNVDVSYCI